MLRLFIIGGLIAAGFYAANVASADHTGNTYNCDNFADQASAQNHYRRHPGDQDQLDADGDGVACESNRAPFDRTPVLRVVASTATPTRVPVVQVQPTQVQPTAAPQQQTFRAPRTGDGGLVTTP